MTKTNVPKVRFGEFTGQWKKILLKNYARVDDGIHQTPNYKKSGIPFFSVENLKNMKTDKYISDDEYISNFKNKTTKKGDVLMSRIGSVGETNIINNDDPLSFYVTLALISPNNEVDSLFLNYLLKSPSAQIEIWRRTLHVAFPKKINKNEISKLPLNISNLEEQQKIGSFFAKIDKLVELQTKKLKQLKKLKQGYLQKMFPQDGESLPRFRFSGFSGEWDNKRLDEIANRITRKNKNLDSELPLTISAQYGLIDQESFFNKKVASKDLSNYLLVMDGEFAYNKSYSKGYPFGAIKSLKKYKMGVVSNLYIVFSIKKTTSHSFMDSFFDSNHWHKEVSVKTTEGARNHGLLNISPKDFMGSKIFLPSKMEEQKEIGSFFSKLDELIKCEGEKLAELKEQKKVYLQKMFI